MSVSATATYKYCCPEAIPIPVRAGRDPAQVRLLPVSKTHPAAALLAARQHRQRLHQAMERPTGRVLRLELPEGGTDR